MTAQYDSIVERQQKLGEAIIAAGIDIMALNPGPSLRYLTGLEFHLSERPVLGLFASGKPVTMILPELEAGKTQDLGFELKTFIYGEDVSTWGRAIKAGVESMGTANGSIGVEPLSFRMMEMDHLEAAFPKTELVPAGEVVSSLRVQKDEAEVRQMRKAAAMAQNALQEALKNTKAGMTEREVVAEITGRLFRNGSEAPLPFSPHVASGPHSASGHAFPTDRKLSQGDLVVIDWGASAEGYFSDITRTFAVGEVDEELAKIHQIVQDANAAGRAAVRPGATCGSVDAATREVIEAAGYGEYFIHRTGHGLGMEVHEEPYIRAGNEMLLAPGMTFTIEPGIYLPGRGGVRIEDDVVVTETGGESLTDFRRELAHI